MPKNKREGGSETMPLFYSDDCGELYCGDSLAILRELPDGAADAVVTDPPYSSGGFVRSDRMSPANEKYQSGGTKKQYPAFVGDNRDARSWAYWCALWIGECTRILKSGGRFLMFSDWRQLPLASDVVQAGGIVWRGLIAWDKGGASRAPHKGYFRHQCEYVLWGTKGGLAVPSVEAPGPFPGCFSIPIKASEKQHITAKPLKLMMSLLGPIEPNGVVLDPFMGSGTTCIAAAMTGRRYIGIEYSQEYCKIARQRLEATPLSE